MNRQTGCEATAGKQVAQRKMAKNKDKCGRCCGWPGGGGQRAGGRIWGITVAMLAINKSMHSNLKQQLLREAQGRQKERPARSKSRSPHLQPHFSGQRSKWQAGETGGSRWQAGRCKLAGSSANEESRRNVSPSLSAVTSNEDYFREMEQTMLSENKNLKDHNSFLKGQIEGMFERERRYKAQLAAARENNQQLQAINAHLQQQFQTLVGSILAEIQRIQALIEEQRHHENLFTCSNLDLPLKHNELCASETESTINRDLEDLKAKVRDICQQTHCHLEEPPAHSCPHNHHELSRHLPKREEQVSGEHDCQAELPVSLLNKSRHGSRRSSKHSAKILP